MSLDFGTKEEMKKKREDAFLALEPTARFQQFLQLMASYQVFATKGPDRSDHFVLEKSPDFKETSE